MFNKQQIIEMKKAKRKLNYKQVHNNKFKPVNINNNINQKAIQAFIRCLNAMTELIKNRKAFPEYKKGGVNLAYAGNGDRPELIIKDEKKQPID